MTFNDWNPIEHGCNQTIRTKKEPKNHTIEHENGCDVAALYRRIFFGAPYYCAVTDIHRCRSLRLLLHRWDHINRK
jgi:hypothetical protein